MKRSKVPRARIASAWQRTHPRVVTWHDVWHVVRHGDLAVPIVLCIAGVVCAVLSAIPHAPRSPVLHVASFEHLGSIAIMWFALAGVNVLRRILSAWWSLRRVAAPADVRARWSVGDAIGTVLLVAWTTAQLTAI